MVWALTIVPMMFAVDAMLRAYAETRFLLLMNIVRFAVVASLIGLFIDSFGLIGAVLATLTALTASKAIGVVRIARIVGVPMTQVLPWGAMGRITARALGAAIPAWLLAETFGDTPWLAFVTGSAAYGAAYAVLSYAPGVAEPTAIRLPIVEKIRSMRRRADAVASAPASLATTGGK